MQFYSLLYSLSSDAAWSVTSENLLDMSTETVWSACNPILLSKSHVPQVVAAAIEHQWRHSCCMPESLNSAAHLRSWAPGLTQLLCPRKAIAMSHIVHKRHQIHTLHLCRKRLPKLEQIGQSVLHC